MSVNLRTPGGLKGHLAWVLAAVIVILADFGVMGELRGARRPASGR
ncbi:MAG TPA: hypothetical protein VE525_01845 [Rubrobacter sp.]|jgi:hypothetical protein|nr:hypothetical protein [Rubrobacter sp.]